MNSRFTAPFLDWLLFSLFLIVNSLLAYGPFSLPFKLWVGLIALVAVIVFSHFSESCEGKILEPFGHHKSLLDPPLWLGLFFIGAGLFLRFYKLNTLATWPDPDESLHSMNAIHIGRYWDWRCFYTYSQAPFLFPWLLAFWFKLFQPSLWSLWFFTAFFSALVIPLIYLAARSFFQKGFSLVLTAFGALAYWGLFAGRNGNATILTPLSECLALWLLGKLLDNPTQIPLKTGFLGLVLALGFYVYPPAWLPFALAVSVLMAFRLRKEIFPFVIFISVFFAAILPLWVSVFREHYGSYIGSIKWNSHSLGFFQQLLVSTSYITGLFWGKEQGDYYGPYWGGLFDSITASLFLMGIRYAWNNRQNPAWIWIGAVMALALVPGLLSGNVEFYRVYLIFPFILFLATLGCHGLASSLKPHLRSWFLAVILTGMALLNFYHLLGPYHDHWDQPGPSWSFYKSPENARAYGIVRQISSELGPGYIFQNFPSDMYDQSLALVSYPVNMAANPLIKWDQPRWFAVLINDNYKTFLLKRFPGGRWFSLSQDLNRPDGGLGLGVFPLGSIPPPTLRSWLAMNNAFGEVTYAFLNRPTGTDYDSLLDALKEKHFLAQGDPFLESCYCEKLYYLYLQNKAFGDKKISNNLAPSIEAIQSALQYGYRAAHLYNELGTYLLMMGKKAEAKKAFEDAIHSNPDFAPAVENLNQLLQSKENN